MFTANLHQLQRCVPSNTDFYMAKCCPLSIRFHVLQASLPCQPDVIGVITFAEDVSGSNMDIME